MPRQNQRLGLSLYYLAFHPRDLEYVLTEVARGRPMNGEVGCLWGGSEPREPEMNARFVNVCTSSS